MDYTTSFDRAPVAYHLFLYDGAHNAQRIVDELLALDPHNNVLNDIDTYLIGADNFCHICGLKGGH